MANAELFTRARAQLGDALAALRAARTDVAKVDAITTVLRIIGTLAQNAPTQELATRWLEQYRILQPQAAALRSRLSSGAPGELTREIGKLYDAVTTFAGQVLEGAGGVVAAAPTIVKSAPWLLALAVVAVVVVAIVVGPQLVKSYGRRK